MNLRLPELKPSRTLLSELLRREVTIRPAHPLTPSPRNPCTVAVYRDSHSSTRLVAVVDLALSAHFAAAHSQLPTQTAGAAAADGALDEEQRASLVDVLDLVSPLFSGGDADHVLLEEVHHAGDPLRPDLLMRALSVGQRVDIDVEVAGHGGGSISVIIAE